MHCAMFQRHAGGRITSSSVVRPRWTRRSLYASGLRGQQRYTHQLWPRKIML